MTDKVVAVRTDNIHLLAWTQFDSALADRLTGWNTDAEGGQALAEFAGRACYQSFSKPNPATATNAGYMDHIMDVGHFSILEHGTATFYFEEVPRSFTHELVRHRHFSYSQLSQRFEDEYKRGVDPVYPPDADVTERNHILEAHEYAMNKYKLILDRRLARQGEAKQGVKQAREAARSVLLNANETKIVVTGNYRAWRHFIDMRATPHADLAMNVIAIGVLNKLIQLAPNVFDDYLVDEVTVGGVTRLVAESKYAK
jgi:thymidylate synthase (FAD)